jgi:hypothetical protein
MFEIRPAVEADTGETEDGKIHRQRVALLAVGIIPRRAVNLAYATVREGRSVEICRCFGITFIPKAEDGFVAHFKMPFCFIARI